MTLHLQKLQTLEKPTKSQSLQLQTDYIQLNSLEISQNPRISWSLGLSEPGFRLQKFENTIWGRRPCLGVYHSRLWCVIEKNSYYSILEYVIVYYRGFRSSESTRPGLGWGCASHNEAVYCSISPSTVTLKRRKVWSPPPPPHDPPLGGEWGGGG